jgi:hypothetical protein
MRDGYGLGYSPLLFSLCHFIFSSLIVFLCPNFPFFVRDTSHIGLESIPDDLSKYGLMLKSWRLRILGEHKLLTTLRHWLLEMKDE